MFDFIQSWDYSILDFIQQNMRSDFLDIIMALFSNALFGLVLWAGVPILMLAVRKYRWGGAAVLIALAISLLLGNVILKFAFARPRPCWWELTGHLPIENMLVKIPSDFSFPSAHTFVSFSVAFTALRNSRAIGIPSVIMAACIAVSRLYVYVHFPSDVIVGFILSIPAAIVSDILAKMIMKKIEERRKKQL